MKFLFPGKRPRFITQFGAQSETMFKQIR